MFSPQTSTSCLLTIHLPSPGIPENVDPSTLAQGESQPVKVTINGGGATERGLLLLRDTLTISLNYITLFPHLPSFFE